MSLYCVIFWLLFTLKKLFGNVTIKFISHILSGTHHLYDHDLYLDTTWMGSNMNIFHNNIDKLIYVEA